MENETELIEIKVNPADLMKNSNDVADVCRDIVKQTACTIKQKKYVKIEGWSAIAIAHGCTLSASAIKKEENGFSVIGTVRRSSDGMILCEAEGYCGRDEYNWKDRDEYALRAMAQTRAMSRAARTAFSHIIVMIDSELSSTPAEEVPANCFESNNDNQAEYYEGEIPVNIEQAQATFDAQSNGGEVIKDSYGTYTSTGQQAPKEWWDSGDKFNNRDYSIIGGDTFVVKKAKDKKWYVCSIQLDELPPSDDNINDDDIPF